MSDQSRSDPSDDGLGHWLRSRWPDGGLSAKASAVVTVLATQPRTASYGGTSEVAVLAGVNVATVTRTAQALGFAGWPDLRRELRARYLSSLSAPEVAAEHGALDGGVDGAPYGAPGAASLRRDLDDLAVLRRGLDLLALGGAVQAIALAGRIVVVASGSYAAVGTALVHNVRLAGYDAVLVTDAAADLANSLATLEPGDVVVAVSFWRLYTSALQAAHLGAKQGATVCVLTDTASSPLAALAEHLLVVPAEGVSFFPSLTPAMAAVQALCAELAALDPARTRSAIEAAEGMWEELGLLHRGPTRA